MQGNVAVEALSERVEAVLFELAGQRFAVPLSAVQELTRACAVQAVPKAPRPVLGVLNLRGTVVPLLDLRERFELPEKPLEPADFFVFARCRERSFALRVDRILGIEWLESVPASQSPNLPAHIDYLSGVAAVADGVILIYDLGKFLSQSEVTWLDRVLEPEPSAGEP